jgi:AcrR family transcriptional regulator
VSDHSATHDVSQALYAERVATEPSTDNAHTDPRVFRTREAAIATATHLLLTQGIGAVTHLNVANESGVGRKTLYRHWATAGDLLYETVSRASFPQGARTGELRADLVRHLEALRQALVEGPLGYLIHALNERAQFDPQIASVRDRLTAEGCEPIREILRQAIRSRQLPAKINIEEAASQLEGPLFYRTLVRNEQVPGRAVKRLVDQFVALYVVE